VSKVIAVAAGLRSIVRSEKRTSRHRLSIMALPFMRGAPCDPLRSIGLAMSVPTDTATAAY
jgi:hypothetical protein